MKLAIPTDGPEGLDAAVSGHLGRALFYTVVDAASGEVTVVPNAPHGEGHCNPAGALSACRVDAVLCAGVGRRAVAALEAAGIDVLLTRSATAGAAVADWRANGGTPLGADDACGGSGGSCRH